MGHTDSPETESEHDRITRTAIATKIAALSGYEFAGDYDPARRYPLPLYFVPSHTIVGLETAGAQIAHQYGAAQPAQAGIDDSFRGTRRDDRCGLHDLVD